MRTIERNYRKNPHTANFLMTFHAAAQSLPAELDENGPEYALAASDGADLLDTVNVDAPVDVRTPGQRKVMDELTRQITELDAELGARTAKYIADKSAAGAWVSPRRDADVSQWIGHMIEKRDELRAAARAQAPVEPVRVEDGRYAVEEDGVLRFFKVKNGRRSGFVFLDIQASDEWHSIRNLGRIRAVLALIAQDPHAAMVRYGTELGRCYRCGRTLTDEVSRGLGIGPDCRSK